MLAWLAPYQLRLVFRGAFTLLALATVTMALYVLWEEKELSYHNYQYSFRKTAAEVGAKLHHPSGQLALLNPPRPGVPVVPLHPLLLPFSAIDFDDRDKVQQAVEMSGCQVQYKAGTVCVAVGNNPWAGGFIYVAGSFASSTLVAHAHGRDEIFSAHHVLLSVNLRGQNYRWIAPFEAMGNAANGMHGRLTGFVDTGDFSAPRRPVKDFRGWIWQSPACMLPHGNTQNCLKRAFFSVRLPIGLLRDDLFQPNDPLWPPADLERIQVHVRIMPPDGKTALIDSDNTDALPPFALSDLAPLLLPGETLHIRRFGGTQSGDLLTLVGSGGATPSHWLSVLVRHLPVDGYDKPLEIRQIIATPMGNYELALVGDVGSVNQSLSAVATRVSWFVGTMLLGLLLVWFIIEVGIIRRITELTRRAASVSQSVKGSGSFAGFDLSDLRGPDELGVLARCLADLLQRVKEDVERERIRAEQEKDMWHAVGHEIMSPLQSLMALHGSSADESSRYINRMQQAVRILYGNASPSEAFQASTLQIRAVDIDEFLRHVASNAPCVGINHVEFHGDSGPVLVRADEYSLEDVVTHVLRNADRFRAPDSAIGITLNATETTASVSVHNTGPHIPDNLIERIFEYGVSDQQDAGANGNRGQGLFVAKTYMAKMGGTISAQNVEGGVSFVLSLQRAPAAALAGALL